MTPPSGIPTLAGLARRLPLGSRRGPSLAKIQESGYFDPAWYHTSYPEVDDVGLSPFLHYIRVGFAEGRNPGPLFDGQRYLRENPDVAHAGVNPLLHALRAPASEQRSAWSVAVPAPPGKENLVVAVRPMLGTPPSLAVMVHAYYPETFEMVCRSLRSLPPPYTLLVSVADAAGREAVRASIKRHRLTATSDVRIVPNRGRNFAPLVAEFAPEILGHDLVLHLHTKRSLYTGSEQAAWRDELIHALIGSPAIARSSWQLFEDREDIGLLYPVTTASLSYWAHHWLRNGGRGADLFSRLGVADYPRDGYFPYPVGGMFWARVEAIRPLLEAGFNFDDFPPEEGQTDGTLAHAIERSFVSLARSREFRFVEFDAATGAWQLDWSRLNLDQYLGRSYNGLCRAIDDADLVSFDIFDTVITRLSVRPDSVMRAAGQRLAHEFEGATDFFLRRKQAETSVREAKNWEGDASLAEIYRAFPRDEIWTEEVIVAARSFELEGDLNATIPRSIVANAVRHAVESGKRVIAISDTYLEREQIEQLLKAAGLDGQFHALSVFRDRGAQGSW